MNCGSNSENAGSGPAWPHRHPPEPSSTERPGVSARRPPLPKHLFRRGSAFRNKPCSALPSFPKPTGLPMSQQSSRNRSMPGCPPKDDSQLRYHRQGNRCCQSLSDGKFTRGFCHRAASGGILCLTRRAEKLQNKQFLIPWKLLIPEFLKALCLLGF